MLEQQTLRRVVTVGYRFLLLWLFPMAVFVGIFAWRVFFVDTPANGPKAAPLLNAADQDYSRRIAHALTVPDQLSAYFRVQPVVLSGRLSDVSSIEVGHGRLAIVDNVPEPSVYIYDAYGHFNAKLGAAGSGPGKYLTPTDIAIGDSVAAVSDFTTKRINIFSLSGELRDSFAYGPQGFSASALAFDQQLDQFFIFGNKWPKKPGDSLLFVHRYSITGQYLGSEFVLPQQGEQLGLDVDDQPMVRHAKKSIWFMLPWDYRVFGILNDGSTGIVFDPPQPAAFKPPSSRPPVQPAFATFQHWLLSWTPIVSFASDGNTLLVERECFCDARFGIDMWSLRTGHLQKQFSTNWKLLGYDEQSFYFVHDRVENDGKHTYEFDKALLASKS
jgi:hypothetical protein